MECILVIQLMLYEILYISLHYIVIAIFWLHVNINVFRYPAILKHEYFRDGPMDIFCGLPTSINYSILLKHAVHQTNVGWLQQCWLRTMWHEMKLTCLGFCSCSRKQMWIIATDSLLDFTFRITLRQIIYLCTMTFDICGD